MNNVTILKEATIRQDIKLEYPKDYFKNNIKIKENNS